MDGWTPTRTAPKCRQRHTVRPPHTYFEKCAFVRLDNTKTEKKLSTTSLKSIEFEKLTVVEITNIHENTEFYNPLLCAEVMIIC